jgi:hypothetical protein
MFAMNYCLAAATTKHVDGNKMLIKGGIGWRATTSSTSMTRGSPQTVISETMCCTTPEWFYTANVRLEAGMKIPAFFCHSKGWVRILRQNKKCAVLHLLCTAHGDRH